MKVQQFNTSIVQDLGVGFYKDSNGDCHAFFVKDAEGFFNQDDIQEGVFDAKLLELPYPLVGADTIASLIHDKKSGTIKAELYEDIEWTFQERTDNEIFTINKDIYEKTIDELESITIDGQNGYTVWANDFNRFAEQDRDIITQIFFTLNEIM
jgi:hypothetical protein